MLITKLLIKITGQRMVLPFYHTVSDEPLPHIRHLYQAKGVKAFEADLDFLLRNFKPLTFTEFSELALKKEKPPTPCFLLSFDDGLREFHDIAAPVLLRKGIPAVCFLNSAFIDSRDLFFRYKVSLLIDAFAQQPDLSAMPEVKEWMKANAVSLNIKEGLLAIRYDKKDALDKLAEVIGVDFRGYLSSQKPYMTSGQIESLQKQGFTFGAHSIDHPEFRFIPLQEQLRQTRESMEDVQARFQTGQRLFSFPFTDYGVSAAFFNEIFSSGSADFTFGCAGIKKEKIARHYQRIGLENGERSARQIIHSEFLYYICKAPFGRNTIHRT